MPGIGNRIMIYSVNVPYITTYTHWVEAENVKEAIAKAKNGILLDIEETGETSGKFQWNKAKVYEDSFHTGRLAFLKRAKYEI